ncbi:MAG: PTS sugar transporter subunit IIA [Candidatus Eisenbacteria bacterium]|nr:PTS sugar transporter subunit IIA [Candidatus Eisenbacteria bacterium]
MRLSPYLQNGFVCFEMETRVEPPEEEDYDREKHALRVKEGVICELAGLFAETGRVGNRNKLFLDLWNREKKASTAVGHNLALPHIRSNQVKDPILGFARSTEGYDFGAPDGEKVHIFVALIGSNFDPDAYLKVYKELAEMFRFDVIRERLFECWSEGELYRLFDGKF